MPARRRPAQISAAALPASRLPVGTPVVAKHPRSTDTTSDSSHLLQQRTSASSLRKDKSADSDHRSIDSAKSFAMASNEESGYGATRRIAEAKLERQQKRIEEGEVPMRRKHGARGKTKQWKPFDFTADTPKTVESDDFGGVPVSEVRVNTFRAISREPSSARSPSLLSHRTNDTGPSDRDMDYQDSASLDSSFQVVTRRGQKKPMDELNAYEDSPEKRQTTVEATFDTRAIYEVFGNALPNPRFIEENAGTRNGEVQFTQHPNGDVSAHQWSADRFMWENIGQFSNIRKKIEGQLASERLKGETAYQTLQQNTLAYFRTIAKQREATVMGVPFGAKDIQAAMPQQQPVELASAPTGFKETPKVAIPLKLPQAPTEPTAKKMQEEHGPSTTSALLRPTRQFLPQNILQRQTYYGQNFSAQTPSYDDPFYSSSNYQQIYGGWPHLQRYQTKPHQASGNPYFGIAQQPQGMNYNFQFPSTLQNTRRQHDIELSHGPVDGRQSVNPPARPHTHMTASTTHSTPVFHGSAAAYGTPATEIAAPQPKQAVPFGNRGSMSDQLWKISETAKERNLSQSNIGRTVLYDPYRDRAAQPNAAASSEPSLIQRVLPGGPEFSQNVTDHKLQPPASFDPTSANFFPTVLAPPQSVSPEPVQSSSPVAAMAQSNIQQSSPDSYRTEASYDPTTQPDARATQLQPTPQTFQPPFFPAETSSQGQESHLNQKSYDEKLQDWWTSGNKFARQEEFFESIKAVHKLSDGSSAISSPPARLAPIGPPSSAAKKKQDTSAFNPTTTRLLIPVLENLASYVEGPVEKRRDYFCPWSTPPEWCIDRSETGNDSFFDNNWGQPPARVGRDPRYQNRSWTAESTPQSNLYNSSFGSPGSGAGFGIGVAVGSGIDRRFNFAGRH